MSPLDRVGTWARQGNTSSNFPFPHTNWEYCHTRQAVHAKGHRGVFLLGLWMPISRLGDLFYFPFMTSEV